MTKNHFDLRDAVFQSPEYLATVLALSAFTEKNFCHKSTKGSTEIGHGVIALNKAILQYTAEVWAIQNRSIGKGIQDTVTSISNHRLTQLQRSMEVVERKLRDQINLEFIMRSEDRAESILSKIDKEVSNSLRDLFLKFNLPAAESAAFDSFDEDIEDRCLPGTRVELLQEVAEWASSPKSKCIFWLDGMAGTGKSTIARTVAQDLKAKGQLGASFFFKKGAADRGNANRLMPTLARQLMNFNWQFADGLTKAIERESDIATKGPVEQFNRLLLQPLLSVDTTGHETSTMVIVIDALDECENDTVIKLILELFPKLRDAQCLRPLIFLTSRPDPPIRQGFKKHDTNDNKDLVLHEVPPSVIESDIRIYLNYRFSGIRDAHAELPSDWPGDAAIIQLVTMAVPLFIFAATICRYIERAPRTRLDKVLPDAGLLSTKMQKANIDPLYSLILDQLLVYQDDADEREEFLEQFHGIIGVIILLETPLSVVALARLIRLGQSTDRVAEYLDNFHSVLRIPRNLNEPVRILHISFREFLLRIKGSSFRVDPNATHRRITSHCLDLMNDGLRRNICELPSYGTERETIDKEVIKQYLSEDLQYSCRYWVQHLVRSNPSTSLVSSAFSFLKRHFLHWLEAMNILGSGPEMVEVIDMLRPIMQVSFLHQESAINTKSYNYQNSNW